MSEADDTVTVFVVTEVGSSADDDGNWRPTCVIDAGGNPEVADLARVHAVEGIGDVATVAMRAGSAIVLGIGLTSPVRAAFALAFSAEEHAPFLDEVAEAGMLAIATTDPERAGEDRPLWLAVDIDGDALRSVLRVG